MSHNIVNISEYHAGDALNINVPVFDDAGARVDITGASAEWFLTTLEDRTTRLVEKTVANGGIELTNPANGELVIRIATGDTAALNGAHHHRCRLTDSAGRRATIFVGTIDIED